MKKCLVELSDDSAGIGDLLVILPYLEKFRLINDYEIYFKFKNTSISEIFTKSYPNITFVPKNDETEYDKKINLKHLSHDNTIQRIFASQLGFFDAEYIRPIVDDVECERPIKNKYITFNIHSTSQLKYWNHPDGIKDYVFSSNWNNLCKMLRKSGYTPVCIDYHENFGKEPIRNHVPVSCVKRLGLSIPEVIKIIKHAEFHIGLSSGLSWLAHSMNKPVCMISNFSEDWHEIDLSIPDYKRITNKSVCHGCWNLVGKEFKFEHSDWFWCPRHKGTERQFECHTSITPEMVFDEIKEWLI